MALASRPLRLTEFKVPPFTLYQMGSFDSHSSLTKQCPSINLESNPGQLGEKRERYLCAILPTLRTLEDNLPIGNVSEIYQVTSTVKNLMLDLLTKNRFFIIGTNKLVHRL